MSLQEAVAMLGEGAHSSNNSAG